MANGRSKHNQREDFYRGVYEDNKRIDDKNIPRRQTTVSRSYATGIGGVVLLGIVLVLATNFVFRDARSVSPRAENVSALIAEAAMANLGIPADADIPDVDADYDNFSTLASAPVPMAELFNLGVRKIIVDAGHGGRDPGALGADGLMEKEITLDVALRLKHRLTEYHGIEVLLTRDADQTVSLKKRAELSNDSDADLFVSIHVNQFPEEPVYALETYFFGPQADGNALRLAELENQNSDYSVAEFSQMIQNINDRVKSEESSRLARHVQASMFRNSRELNPQVRNWGVKTAPFVVLVGAKVPGILSEIGVISNSDEERRLRTPEYREQLAMFLEEGIVTYLNDLSKQAASQNGVTEHATEEKTH